MGAKRFESPKNCLRDLHECQFKSTPPWARVSQQLAPRRYPGCGLNVVDSRAIEAQGP